MAAHEKLSVQFQYNTMDLGESKPSHRLAALSSTGHQLGTMLWNTRGIRNVIVSPDQQRRGIATSLWHEGHRLASENAKIPAPKHSPDRTDAGDAWARSVGGRLPRRK